jgi:hypothetical protein
MDTRDKQFDNWIKNNLNTEITLSKQHRQSAWEQIHAQATLTQPSLSIDEDYIQITAQIANHEALPIRILRWVAYFITHEIAYQRARNNSVNYYKAKPNYSGGLTLHGLEMMRHHWTYSV